MKQQDHILFGYIIFRNNEHQKIATRHQQLAFLLYFFNHYLKGHHDFAVERSEQESSLERELTSLLASHFLPESDKATPSISLTPAQEKDILANAAQWIQESQVRQHRAMYPSQRRQRAKQASLLSPEFKFNSVFSHNVQAANISCAPTRKESAAVKRKRSSNGSGQNTKKKKIKTQLNLPPTESPLSVRDIASWEEMTQPNLNCTTVNRSGKKLLQPTPDYTPIPLYVKRNPPLVSLEMPQNSTLKLQNKSQESPLELQSKDDDIMQILLAELECDTNLHELLNNHQGAANGSVNRHARQTTVPSLFKPAIPILDPISDCIDATDDIIDSDQLVLSLDADASQDNSSNDSLTVNGFLTHSPAISELGHHYGTIEAKQDRPQDLKNQKMS